MKQYSLIATVLSAFFLSSCTTQLPVLGSKIYIVLDMNQPGEQPNWYVVKNLPYANERCNGHHRYFVFGGHCYMWPRDYVPDTIILEYARWLTPAEERARGFVAPSGTSVAMEKAADGRRDAAIDQLPPSAWRKITIKPKQLIAKYQHRMPAGHPEGYLFPDSRTREIWIQMDMQADGTVKISERYKWRYGPGGISNWR